MCLVEMGLVGMLKACFFCKALATPPECQSDSDNGPHPGLCSSSSESETPVKHVVDSPGSEDSDSDGPPPLGPGSDEDCVKESIKKVFVAIKVIWSMLPTGLVDDPGIPITLASLGGFGVYHLVFSWCSILELILDMGGQGGSGWAVKSYPMGGEYVFA